MNAMRAWNWFLFVSAATALPAAASGSPLADPPADEIFLNGYEQFTLTIDNVLAWCSIHENGGTGYSLSAVFNQGTVVDLSAAPQPGFIWGHWEGTDGDTGSGDTNQTTTVTMTSDRAVIACCPFPNGTGC